MTASQRRCCTQSSATNHAFHDPLAIILLCSLVLQADFPYYIAVYRGSSKATREITDSLRTANN